MLELTKSQKRTEEWVIGSVESTEEMQYNTANQLISYQGKTIEYDAENNRIASRDSQTGKTIRYIHNTNSDLSQFLVEEDGTTTTKYVYGNELVSAKTYEKSLEELKQEGDKNKKVVTSRQTSPTTTTMTT